MFSKFFKLKVVDPASGHVHHATWSERFNWLWRGRPLRNEKVVERFVQIKNGHAVAFEAFSTRPQSANTQVV